MACFYRRAISTNEVCFLQSIIAIRNGIATFFINEAWYYILLNELSYAHVKSEIACVCNTSP